MKKRESKFYGKDSTFAQAYQLLNGITNTVYLQSHFSLVKQLAENVTVYGAVGDGATVCDTAVTNAKTASKNKKLLFPQNATNNAVYYFTATPTLDGYNIYADVGVKLSFPTTNGKSFKYVKFSNTIDIISRDRTNTGTQFANEISKQTLATLTDNNIDIGIKKPVFIEDADIEKVTYDTDGSSTVGGITYYDAARRIYKVQDATQLTDLTKLYATQVPFKVGDMFNCLFKPAYAVEVNTSVRLGVYFALNGDNFLFYSFDINGNMYKGVRNAGVWTETQITKFANKFTSAYKVISTVIISARPISNSKVEIFMNGVLVDVVSVSFNAIKIGFGQNTVKETGSGIMNYVWGNITKAPALKVNNGNTINTFVYGDSVTFGEGSISWAEHLPSFLEGQRGITKLNVTNRAVSGQRVSQQLTVMQSDTLSNCDIVMILIGTNDIQSGTTPATFGTSLQSMIDLAKGAGCKVVVGVPPLFISQSLTGAGFASSNFDKGAEIRAKVVELCATNDIVLADTMSELGRIGVDNHLDTLRDNLHPNTFGQILLARCFARSVISAFNNDVTPSAESQLSYTPSVSRQALTLLNSWVYFGTPYGNAQATKYDSGKVTISGLVKNGVITNATTVATIPVGFRPLANCIFFVANSNGVGGYDFAVLDVSVNGDIKISKCTYSNWLSLDGIQFNVTP